MAAWAGFTEEMEELAAKGGWAQAVARVTLEALVAKAVTEGMRGSLAPLVVPAAREAKAAPVVRAGQVGSAEPVVSGNMGRMVDPAELAELVERGVAPVRVVAAQGASEAPVVPQRNHQAMAEMAAMADVVVEKRGRLAAP